MPGWGAIFKGMQLFTLVKKYSAKVLFLAIVVCFLGILPLAQADELDPGYWGQTPLPQTGVATFYADGLMAYVQGYRQQRGQITACPECVGTVALLRAGDIGRKVWLQPPGGERVGPFLVVDCAHREDVAPLLARNWVVDVSYEVGQLWGMTQPLAGVTVSADPSDATWEGLSQRVPTPFYVPPGEVVITGPTPTAAVTPARPTPWPTRLPVPLGPLPALATVTPVPLATLPPMPLTPIVTTPTPRVTLAPTAPRAQTVSPTPSPTPMMTPEVAIGRPGLALLLATEMPSPVATATQVTPPPTLTPVRTPRPTSQPILPPARPTPTPTPEHGVSLWVRLWHDLLGK